MAQRVEMIFDTFTPHVVWVRSSKDRPATVRVAMEPSIAYNLTPEDAVLLANKIADVLDQEPPTYRTRKGDRRRLAAYARGVNDDD